MPVIIECMSDCAAEANDTNIVSGDSNRYFENTDLKTLNE